MHADAGFVREAFEAGAAGYVLKSDAGSEIVKAIRQVLLGKTFLSPRLGEVNGYSTADAD